MNIHVGLLFEKWSLEQYKLTPWSVLKMVSRTCHKKYNSVRIVPNSNRGYRRNIGEIYPPNTQPYIPLPSFISGVRVQSLVFCAVLF
jgi:hypothetical protein